MNRPFYVATTIGVLALGASFAAAGAHQQQPPQQPPAVSPAPADAAPASVLDGAYTDDQAKRGEAIYAQSCASCHGGSLEGGEEAPPLTGGAFNSNWAGATMAELFDRVRLTMPADNPGKLSRQEDADVVAYTLSIGKFPSGKTELPTESEPLKRITFVAPKPKH